MSQPPLYARKKTATSRKPFRVYFYAQGERNNRLLTPGPAAFSGTTFNLLQKINRDQFSVRYDKVLYLKRSREFNSTGSQLQFNQGPHPVVL